MKWHEKFKVGQKVKVVKEVVSWELTNGGGAGWELSGRMDKSIGRVYEIIEIDMGLSYKLSTRDELEWNYWYPAESLEAVNIKGRQLLFDFM